jgi:ankyrin repeat protein
MAWGKAVFRYWVRAHVTVFLHICSLFEWWNDCLFSAVLRLALWRARSKESVQEAMARGDVRKAEALVRKGTDLAEPDDKGRTALHLALEHLEEAAAAEEDDADDAGTVEGQPRVRVHASMARQADALDGPTDGRAPSSAAWLVLVRCMLAHGADVHRRDGMERPPIHMAVKAGLHEATRSLLEAGADPTCACKGTSTLHTAAARRDTRMVALLLDAATAACDGRPAVPAHGVGAVSALDKYVDSISRRDGWSALGIAARAGDAAVVTALLRAGADRAVVMKNGKTALDIARLNKKDAVVRLLES